MDNNNITYNDLVKSIEHWNEYRVPILQISQPDKGLNFQGAMRFYFQDSGQKVATKCVKVTSNDTTKDVIDVLIEKFRPDMRMLSVPEYGLYEIHENGDERKLGLDERPLSVQLEWNKDDREGRFLLRRMDEKTRDLAAQSEEPSLRRKLSKKEKKKQDKLKKQQKKEQEKADAAASKRASKNKNSIAEEFYNELPETSFTRSISNPEAVMKRRRAQKLEKMHESGGTLRILGESINHDVFYKTLYLSPKDTASFVVKQFLEKYGKEHEDINNYCLFEVIVPHSAAANGDNNSVNDFNSSAGLEESILDDTDCPLLIDRAHDKSRGILTFHIRPKPVDYHRKRKKKLTKIQGQQQNPLHPRVVQQLNQRLQLNNTNHPDQFRDQNSPQNSSQTSGSLNHDLSNLPPPPFETVHSVPSIYPARANGNGVMYYQQQPHSISTLPMRMNNHPMPNNMHDMSATLQRQNYHHPQNPMINHQGRPLAQNHTQPNQYPVPQPQPPPSQLRHPYVHPQANANDQILPALIQVKEDVEDIFLSRVITHINPTDVTFRLAPTYVFYMVSRYRASTLFRPELQAPSRAELFMPFTQKIASMIWNTIEAHARDPSFLAFWLANSSDLCHFYKQDKHLSHFTLEAQEILYDSIKASFKFLLSCKQLELDAVLHTFFDERDDNFISNSDPSNPNSSRTAVDPILEVLGETMATMRKNRVNAALTIQIFSHLFHHISKWLFDRLIGYDNRPGVLGNQQNYEIYCNRPWGEKLSRRLATIGNWAEKQGLEQAADFHFTRVTKTTIFLSRRYSQRVTPNDLREACDKCCSFGRLNPAEPELNPVQLQALLRRYKPEEPNVGAIIKGILYQMDNTFIASDFNLGEDFEPKIPFIIPEDGYSSELIRYLPNGLLEFVSYLAKIRVRDQELCIFTVQPTSSGHWTVYFKNNQPEGPEIVSIQVRKKNNSMGLSIMTARGTGHDHVGVYIKNVVKNGAAAMDGRLQAGDQLLEVNGIPLLDVTQEQAADFMTNTGPCLTLKIAKQAAKYHKVSEIQDCAPTQEIVAAPQQQHPPYIPPVMHPPQAFAPPMVASVPQPPPPPPPPPVPVEPIVQHNSHMQSPIKSPKKVSWVDTQPHQSLHTLIPLSEEPDIPEMMLMGGTNGQETNMHHYQDQEPPTSYLDHNQNQPRVRNRERDDEEDEEDEEDEDDDDDDDDDDDEDDNDRDEDEQHELMNHPKSAVHIASTNGQYNAVVTNGTGGQDDAITNGLADTTAESLTLEDIDEVLSSRQTNNWLEESAGVIGTQEVYNDPRNRIVKEKERATADDLNNEKLPFHARRMMFEAKK